jgi:magnesium chelatase subunit H
MEVTENRSALRELAEYNRLLCEDHETPAILRALEGRFVRPAPGGDLLRTPEILPTGRNLHGFDPFRMPSVVRRARGRRHAQPAGPPRRTATRCPSPSPWCSGAPTT